MKSRYLIAPAVVAILWVLAAFTSEYQIIGLILAAVIGSIGVLAYNELQFREDKRWLKRQREQGE